MRIGVIVVSMLVLTTSSSEASKSCMTKTEARQHFGSVHIYWHGNDHCWDATPTRRHGRIHTVRQKDHLDTVIEPPQLSMAERWVDIAQVAQPRIIRKPQPMVTPRGVVMVIIFITLTLAIIMIFEHPRSRRNTPAAG